MKRSDFTKFLDKIVDRTFEGLPWVLGMGVVSLLILVIILFTIVAPFVICIIIGFWVLCYVVGYIREKISQGSFDRTLAWHVRNGKDKIKRWRVKVSIKLKPVITLYFKLLKDMWSLTKKCLKK